MTIISIKRDWGVSPSIVRIETTDTIATVETAGYLASQSKNIEIINKGAFQFTTGDSVLVNGSDGSDFYQLSDDFSSLVPEGGPTGPYLLKSANLEDLPNKPDAFTNFGFGAGTSIVLGDGDFTEGVYTLSNPCPNIITTFCFVPGNIIKLPPANGDMSFLLSEGPEIIVAPGTEAVDIQDNLGGEIITLGSPGAARLFSQDNTTVDGSWSFLRDVLSINGQSGNITLPIGNGIPQLIYINDQSGSDITGSGNINNPYATLSHALGTITPSSTVPYNLQLIGVFTEVNLVLKPWCTIQGNNSSLTVTGSVTLDPTWSGGGELSIEGFAELSLPATVNLDFNAVGSPSTVLRLTNLITTAVSTFNITGEDTNGLVLLASNVFGLGNELIWNITNSYGTLTGSATGDLTLNKTSEFAGNNFTIASNTIIGNLLINSSTTSPLELFFESNKVIGIAAFTQSGSGAINIISKNNNYVNPPQLDNGLGGGSIVFEGDDLTALPQLFNGASYTPNNIADALAANTYFSPSNYTPTAGVWDANSVIGNLKGIDLALAGGGGGSTIQFVYIAPTGDDTLGNGTITAPFLTYEKARSYASGLTPTLTNQFMIIGAPGQYTGMTDMTLSPWVHAHLENCYFQGSGNIIPESTIWGNNNNQSCAIIGPNFQPDFGGSINLDMTGVTPRNNVFLFQDWRYINLSGYVAKGVGTSTFYVKDVRPMSVTQTGSNPPFIDFEFQDCYAEISDSTVNNLSYVLSGFEFESESLPFQIKDCTIHGNWSSTGISGIKTANIEATGNSVYGSISASGSDITVNADIASVWSNPIISSGAIFNTRGSTGTLIAQQLWVNAVSGSDITGTGNVNSPLASFSAALVIAEANATSSNQYLIHIIGDQIITGDFSVYPYVHVDGHLSGMITANFSEISLNIAWQTATANLAFIRNCRFTAPGGMNINFGLGVNNIVYFENCDFFGVTALLDVADPTAPAGTNNILYIKDQIITNAPFGSGVQIQDSQLIADNAFLTNINVVCTGAGGSAGAIVLVKNSVLDGTISITDGGTGAQASLELINTPMSAAPQLLGVNTNLQSDTASYTQVPTFVGGASINNVTINNLSDSVLQTSYVPINFTAIGSSSYSAQSMTAMISGIDSVLGGGGGGDTFQDVYNNTPATPAAAIIFDNSGTKPMQWISSVPGSPQVFLELHNNVNPNSFTIPSWGINYNGINNAPTIRTYARLEAVVNDPSAAFEDSSWRVLLLSNGATAAGLIIDGEDGCLALPITGGALRMIQGPVNSASGIGVTLVGGNATVNTTAVNTGDIIGLNCTNSSGTPGIVSTTIVDQTSFSIHSTNVLDTSTYSWFLIKQA